MLGLFLHLGIPRASLEAKREGKGPYIDMGEPLGCGDPQANMAGAEEGGAGVGPGALKEAYCLLPPPMLLDLAPPQPPVYPS